MIRPILIYPDPILATVSAPVPTDYNPAELIRDMLDTMLEANGIGLAAIQIGVPLRVFVMEVHGHDYAFINPVVETLGERSLANEGCLSLPGIIESVYRYPKVLVKGLDQNMEEVTFNFDGLEAQVVQHEIDHIEGHTLVDAVTDERRRAIKQQFNVVYI